MSLTHQCLHTRLSPNELFSCKYINQGKLEFFRVSFLMQHNVRFLLLHHNFVCNIIFCCIKMHDRNVWIIIVIIAINKCSVMYSSRFNKWMKLFECALMCVCVYLREFFSIFIILKMSFTLTQKSGFCHTTTTILPTISDHTEKIIHVKKKRKGKHLPFYHPHVVFFSFYLFIHSIHFHDDDHDDHDNTWKCNNIHTIALLNWLTTLHTTV